MHDSKLAQEIIQSLDVDEVVDLQWINNNLPNNIQPYMSSRILYGYPMVRNSTSSIIDKLFDNENITITRLGIICIIIGALLFFCIITICWKCYWYNYIKPYQEYNKVSTEYDELLSDVFAHDDLTDYEGDSDEDGSIDSDDSFDELEMGNLVSATKDVKLSLSEMNG